MSRVGTCASIQRAAEKAHFWKPISIHSHAYAVPRRMRASLFSELPRRVLLGNWDSGIPELLTTTRKGSRPPFFYAPDPSPRSSYRHSSLNAVPPIRQRFSWPRRVSHTIAPHLTHMEARSCSSTGYHVPPRV